MAIICQKPTRSSSSILWIHRPFWSQAFLQHLNTSDLHEGDCSANSFHQSSLGEQWCLPGLPAKTTCSHVLIIAYYVCVWMVFVCLISMTCCLWSMIGQGGAKASAGSTPSTQLGSFRIVASCWHVIWEMCSAGGQLYGEGLNQWKIVKSEQSEDINDIISDALFNLLNCLRRWLLKEV